MIIELGNVSVETKGLQNKPFVETQIPFTTKTV